ncbi:MAG: hypothetical protein QF472_02830 [Candidatus Marinimicrobia bacterium]|nr:hypothetical protein [Candidatus Neomarinimicrobiota bacterium]
MRIVLLTAGLIFSSCSVIIPKLIPFNDLPIPTGKYPVGTQVFYWEDLNREEWFTTEKGDFRKLVAQVWYPADTAGPAIPYIDHPHIRTGPLARRIELPEFLLRHIQKVQSNSVLNAELLPSEKVFPLVIFSHGLGGMRMQNTVQMEELASRGYMVVAMDHPFDANVTIFEDGSTAEFQSGLRDGADEAEFWEVRLPQIRTRAADVSFVLDYIQNEIDGGDLFWSQTQVKKVGVMGHSYGGATGIAAAYQDMRIAACLNLDGWMEPVESNIIQNGLSIPFLYLGQEDWDDTPLNYVKLDSLLESSNGTKIFYPGTKHFDFSDTPQFSPMTSVFGIAGSMDMDSLRNELNERILQFFDTHLHPIP